MKALVTGGTGFVGSHIARALVEAGHEVRVLHRSSSKLTALTGLTYESAIGDITDLNSLRDACLGSDWVFHAAAVADYWRSDVSRMFDANVQGTRNVLRAARESGVQRVVFISSAGAVGMRADGLPADETEPFNLPPGRFPYGYSKWLAEEIVREAVAQGQDAVIVNPVVVMGPGDLNLLSGTFVTQIRRYGALTPVTSGGVAVIDVRDVARMTLAAAERGRSGERYILGAANVPYTEWFALIAEIVGVPKPVVYVPDALLPFIATAIDVARALGIPTPVDANQARLGGRDIFFNYHKAWTELCPPEVDMRQSVIDTYRWYVEHGYIKP